MNMDLEGLLHGKTRENERGFWPDGLFKREWFEHPKMRETLEKIDESTECF